MFKCAGFRLPIFGSVIAAVVLCGISSTHSFTQKPVQADRQLLNHRASGQQRPLSYRSPGARHKLVVDHRTDAGRRALQSLSTRTASRIRKYDSFSLIETDSTELARLRADDLEHAQVRDDFNLVLLKRGQIDTSGPEPQVQPGLREPSGAAGSLRMVQFFGPPTSGSMTDLKATGAQVLSYIPNNAYLVWATGSQVSRIRELQSQTGVVQWVGAFHPAYKIDPHLDLDSVAQVSISIDLVDTPTAERTLGAIKSLAQKVLIPEFHAAGSIHIRVITESYRTADIARMAEVIAIEPWSEFKLDDERANQIVAGSLTFESVSSVQIARPSSPGYLSYLNSVGINSDFDFAVDVGDTGLDVGSGDASRVHPDFLNSAGQSRIAYLNDFTADFHPSDPTLLPVHDPSGHGTLNASIVGGFNNRSGSAFVDPLGFQYGLGVAPFVRIGASKLFADDGSFGNVVLGGFVLSAYQQGARISSNSWGACEANGFCNLYTDDSTIVDGLVRDCDPINFGDQGMTLVFAAGNDGDISDQTISTPGTSKNVITVGASENYRPGDSDGCGVGGSSADNAVDIVLFSSGGRVQDGRAKPDLVAPGTHMQGAASQDKLFAAAPTQALGVCNRYFPAGQTLYTWSSGTSHSTPVVSGAAALAFQFLKGTLGTEPSPALVKAFLLNSTSYMTGRLGGDDLPGLRQGWGLLDIGRMFEPTSRVMLDQSPARTFTESGGAPFELTGVVDDPSKEFRVMLTWTDAPGNAATNAPYVNQLNLELTVGGITYFGNVFNGQYSKQGGQPDFVNNVQGIRLPAGVTGPFVIRVRPTLIAGDGVPSNPSPLDQDFALVMTNGREAPVPILGIDTIDDLAQNVTVIHPDGATDSSLIPGENAKITVTLTNHSQVAAATISNAGLSLTVGGHTVGQSGASTFPEIAAGSSGANSVPFEFQIPSDLRCGTTAQLVLDLSTAEGDVKLNVPIQAGRVQSSSQLLLSDDVDGHAVKWKLKKGFQVVGTQAHSGSQSYHVEDPGKDDGDNRLGFMLTKKPISIPANAGHVRLTFYHIFNFEPGYDGGVLQISTDAGETWHDAGSRIIVGGYDGKVTNASNNPLGSVFAWTARGRPGVFSPVVVNLDDFAGQRIKLRFQAGFDNAAGILDGYTGWFIDDVQITANLYSCQ